MAPARSRWFALVAGLSAAGLAGAQTNWTERTVTHPASPSARRELAMAYDSARDVVVLFGGLELGIGVLAGDTWEWDGARWTERSFAVDPPARTWHALAYDSARGVTVLFGGRNWDPLGDTWEYDGTAWVQRAPLASPPATGGHEMAFDSARGVVVLYSNDETWEYDGTTWTRRATANTPPHFAPVRMAFDPLRQRLVAFAFISGTATTWEYDGVDWTQRFPATAPTIGSTGAMAWHAARQRVVMVGGCANCPVAPPVGETWEWDGTDWSLRSPVHRPPRNWGHALAAAQGGGVVQFGGHALTIGETWVLDGADWQRPLPTGPRALDAPALAHDLARQRTVLFGGLAMLGTSWRNDTWEWDGARWHGHVPTGAEPPEREMTALAYDAARAETVLFGGGLGWSAALDDTWTWNGTRWARGPVGPAARFGHTMVFDERRQAVVLFGGADPGSRFDDTWEWTGTRWRQLTPITRPPARWLHAMAYDSRRGVAVLYGGLDASAFSDTWEWDGNGWRQRTPSTAPPPLSQHAMAYDADRQRVVLFERDNTWEWDGHDWRRRMTAASPPSRTRHAMAYDATRREAVVHGGREWRGATLLADTWVYAPAVRGSSTTFGSGCPGAAGVPQLDAPAAPILGSRDFALRVTAAPPRAAVLAALAFTSTATPLPGGCTAYTLPTPLELRGTTAQDGTATLPLPVPDDPALRGGVVFAQALVADPQGAFLGFLSFSQGLRIVLGD